MVKRIGWIAAAVVTSTLAAFLFLAADFTEQQAASPQAAKQMVPDNPSEHTPPVQPIPYSHKQHLSLGLECKDCHTNPEPAKLMASPDASKCTLCHVTAANDKPSIQKLAEYAKSKPAIP